MKNIELYEKTKCYGCSACANICPKNAITMVEDEYGFIFPNIEQNKCINCGLCKKTCIYQKQNDLKNVKKVYAAMSNNKKLLEQSASGALFSTIALDFINSDGIVYGCSMEKGTVIIPKHIRINDKNSIIKIQGSKYANSKIDLIYRNVRQDLINNKKVLFSGTPCQIAALNSYLLLLNTNIDNLFTIDIICHGTPSYRMFEDYIRFIQSKFNVKVLKLNFRDKKHNWGLRGTITIKNKNNVVKKKGFYSNLSSYYKYFLTGKIYRKNCYNCMFASNKRIGDITIGDYWGIEEEHQNYLMENGGKLNLKDGISCLLVNSKKGEKLINNFGKEIIIYDSNFKKVAKHNKQLNNPSFLPFDREKIMTIYKEKGYKGVDNYYYKKMGLKKYLYKIYYYIKEKNKTNL